MNRLTGSRLRGEVVDSQEARPSGRACGAKVSPEGVMVQRLPRSRTTELIPAWESRRAATDPA